MGGSDMAVEWYREQAEAYGYSTAEDIRFGIEHDVWESDAFMYENARLAAHFGRLVLVCNESKERGERWRSFDGIPHIDLFWGSTNDKLFGKLPALELKVNFLQGNDPGDEQ